MLLPQLRQTRPTQLLQPQQKAQLQQSPQTVQAEQIERAKKSQVHWTTLLAIVITLVTSSFVLNAALAKQAGVEAFGWSADVLRTDAASAENPADLGQNLPESPQDSQHAQPLEVSQNTSPDPSTEEALFETWTNALAGLQALQGSTVDPLADGLYTVLLLGTNGSHTDTIMVAAVNPEKQKITLFSIPRDLAVKGQRINEYYSQYGVASLEEEVAHITGLTVDRYAQIDLQGFKDTVDLLGGVTITVDKAIEDEHYPDWKGGYSPYSISVGTYQMNGEEALRYARSRKSTSDFDRAARQQKVLASLKTKLESELSVNGLSTLAEIFKTAWTYTATDVSVLEGLTSYYKYHDFTLFTGFVLSNTNYLYSEINEAGAYILLPSAGNYSAIQKVIKTLVF